MSEGPVSFGKPMLVLVLAGVAAGGYWYYKNWPTNYTSQGYSVGFPARWIYEEKGANRVDATGPLAEDGQGAGAISAHGHGGLEWPGFVFQTLGVLPDWQEEVEIDYKKAIKFTYDDGTFRMLAVGVQRGDAVVIYRVGCPKGMFDINRPVFEKSVKSVQCNR